MQSGRRLIINADDLGLCRPFNEGIRRAATEGWLTSTCVRANGTAVEAAFHDVLPSIPHVGVGVHLNIVEGRTRRTTVPKSSRLYRADGSYGLTFAQLLAAGRHAPLADIEADFRQQIETVLPFRKPDHLDGHQHCHVGPALFDIACRLAREYDIPFIRIPQEPLALANGDYPWLDLAGNVVKVGFIAAIAPRLRRIAARHGVRANDAFVGLLYTGFMDERSIDRGLQATADAGIVELLVHPCADIGRRDDEYLPGIRNYTISRYRARELRAISDPALLDKIRAAGRTLSTYGEAAGWPSQQRPSASPVAMASKPRLRVVGIIDETAFYQPDWLRRIASESQHADLVAVARVSMPGGGILPKYMLRNWHRLGIREFATLGIMQSLIRLKGLLPKWMKGEHVESVQAVLDRHKIPNRTITSVRSEEFHNWVRSFNPDVILSSNSLIFPESLIDIPRIATINRHTALLPSYGGILPGFRAIQHGEQAVGASVHVMTKGIDEGPVISRKWIPVEAGDTLHRLYQLAFVISYDATEEAFARLREHGRNFPALPDEGLKKSYFTFPTPEDWQEFRRRGGRFV